MSITIWPFIKVSGTQTFTRLTCAIEQCWTKESELCFSICAGIIKVKVLKPIPTDGTTPDDVSVITENVRQVMLKVFHEHDHTGNENDVSSIDDKKIN